MNPYQTLEDQAFWKKFVSESSLFEVGPLWKPKFEIREKHKVVTFGSCFAQHIGQALKSRGYNWYIPENAPKGTSEELSKRYNYNVFSARTGNIYTTSLLKQWVDWAVNGKNSPDELWVKDGRFYDPFRPRIEPNGFLSKEELMISRNVAIDNFKRCILESDFFVFTMGLTESWRNLKEGHEYAMCPGTVAGEFDGSLHGFENQDFRLVYRNLKDSIQIIRSKNKSIKFILTVSPVPLVATRSNNNVVSATMYSKSVLRAVAGQLSEAVGYVDYFPSYEIINSPVYKGIFFDPNMRTVSPFGVGFVMDHFFKCQKISFGSSISSSISSSVGSSVGSETGSNHDVVCEEELLSSFGR